MGDTPNMLAEADAAGIADFLERATEIVLRLAWHTRPMPAEAVVDPQTEKFEAWCTEMPAFRYAAETPIRALSVCIELASRTVAADMAAGRMVISPIYDAGRTTIVPVRLTAEEVAQLDDEVAKQTALGNKTSRSALLRQRGLSLTHEDVESLAKAWDAARASER